MNAITTTGSAPLNYGDLERLAASIAQSGLFGIKTKDQAITLMMIAHAEGRHPALAARDYDIINGRPAKKAEAMLRDFLEAGGKVEWHAVTDELADATFTHPQTGSVRIDWDMKRAMTAFGKKDMYSKFPRQMLRSRVVSEGVRTLWPLATSGFYVPEEVRDMPHNGPTLEAEAEAPSPPPSMPASPTMTRAAAAPTPRAERKVAPKPEVYDPNKLQSELARVLTPEQLAGVEAWLAGFQLKLDRCQIRTELDLVVTRPAVTHNLENGPEAMQREMNAMIAAAYDRLPAQPRETPDDLEIAGEAYLAAG